MALRLRHFFHMKEHGSVGETNGPDTGFKSFTHSCIIPGFYPEDLDAIGAFFLLEAFQGFRYRTLGGLIFTGHRNAVTVIPDKNGKGYLQDAGGVDSLPEMSFAGGGIADGAEAHFITTIGQIGERL